MSDFVSTTTVSPKDNNGFYYNSGKFWLAYLNDKKVTNNIAQTKNNTLFTYLDNLCSYKTENMYLANLLKFYFSKSDL